MDKLNKILSEVFRLKEDELNDELTMDDIDNWDSLTHMDLITSIESGFEIQSEIIQPLAGINMAALKKIKDALL